MRWIIYWLSCRGNSKYDEASEAHELLTTPAAVHIYRTDAQQLKTIFSTSGSGKAIARGIRDVMRVNQIYVRIEDVL